MKDGLGSIRTGFHGQGGGEVAADGERSAGGGGARGRAKSPKATRPPTAHIATAPGEGRCWDMTYVPASVMGRWFHVYLILDLQSRKIVGAEVPDSDDVDHAVHLVRRTALAESIATRDTKPVLHGDNGSTLKGPRRCWRCCNGWALSPPTRGLA